MTVAGLAGACALSCNLALAEQGKFSYLEGRYIADVDAGRDLGDGDGLRLAGSYQLNEQIFAFGRWETVEFDKYGAESDLLEAGAGYIYSLNKNWDAHASISLVRWDFEADGGIEDDDTGYSFQAGARGMVTPEIEARAQLVYVNLDESDTYLTLGADYFIQPNLSAGLELDLGGEADEFSLGVRYHLK